MVSNWCGRIGIILGIIPFILFWILADFVSAIISGVVTSVLLGLFGAIVGKFIRESFRSAILGEIIGIVVVVVLLIGNDRGTVTNGVLAGAGTVLMLYFGAVGTIIGILVRREFWGSILGIILAVVYITIDQIKKNSSDLTEVFEYGPITLLAFGIVGTIIGVLVRFIVNKVKNR